MVVDRVRMVKILKKMRKESIYLKLTFLISLFEENFLFLKPVLAEIEKCFFSFKKRLNRIIGRMRSMGMPDGERMKFYRLTCRLLPAYETASKIINI